MSACTMYCISQERKLASLRGYEDPVNPTYEATSKMYDTVVGHLMQETKVGITDSCCPAVSLGKIFKDVNLFRVQDFSGPSSYIVVATHNEASAKLAAERMERLGLKGGKGSQDCW